VVLALEVELENIALLSRHRLGIEEVVTCSCDLDGLGVGQADHHGRGQGSPERRHVVVERQRCVPSAANDSTRLEIRQAEICSGNASENSRLEMFVGQNGEGEKRKQKWMSRKYLGNLVA
jgi:hypothetical protein